MIQKTGKIVFTVVINRVPVWSIHTGNVNLLITDSPQFLILARKCPKKIELFATKTASQRTQLSGKKLKKCFMSYRRLEIGFSFYDHLTYAVSFIFKTVKCVRVKRFYTNNLLLFSPVWDSFSSQNILYLTA